MNAQKFILMTKISPDEKLNVSDDLSILGDKIYPNRYPIITGYRKAQLQRKSESELKLEWSAPRSTCVTFRLLVTEIKCYVTKSVTDEHTSDKN